MTSVGGADERIVPRTVRRRQGFGHEDRQVADDRRITRQRLGAQIVAGGQREQRLRGRSRRRRSLRRREAARFGDRRQQLAEDAERHARRRAIVRSAARPRTRNGDSAAANSARHAEGGADALDHALDVEEVDAASRRRPVRAVRRAAPARAPRRAFARRGREPAAGFEQPDVLARRAGGCARTSRSARAAATAAGRRTSPTADWRSPPARRPARQNGSAACAFDERERHRLRRSRWR